MRNEKRRKRKISSFLGNILNNNLYVNDYAFKYQHFRLASLRSFISCRSFFLSLSCKKNKLIFPVLFLPLVLCSDIKKDRNIFLHFYQTPGKNKMRKINYLGRMEYFFMRFVDWNMLGGLMVEWY
jgi:hypothetical protein